MISSTYLHVQQLITELAPHEQARLLEYLSFRMALMVSELSAEPSPAPSRPKAAAETSASRHFAIIRCNYGQ